jgi:prepilin-type N-terminal cleavage/methylation domain-containing protein
MMKIYNDLKKGTSVKRPAFTMLELVFVIVVLGILASLAIPRLERDLRQEAKDNLLSAIRYTQHLALIDDKTNPTDTTHPAYPNWQRTMWRITFSTSADNLANFYTIGSDRDGNGGIAKTETAIDPANGKYMYNLGGDTFIDADESPNIFIGKTYGINSMNFSGGCAGEDHVAFDNLGKPYTGIETATNDYGSYMASDCNIVMGFADGSIRDLNISIATETGYVSID